MNRTICHYHFCYFLLKYCNIQSIQIHTHKRHMCHPKELGNNFNAITVIALRQIAMTTMKVIQ